MAAPSSRPMQPSNDLWEKALEKLSDGDKQEIDFYQADETISNLDVLKNILTVVEAGKSRCMQKRWKYRKGDHDIIIRDKLEKIAKWVKTFIGVGDTIVQYDPGHAALPWAGVRFLLQITINDSQIYGAMVDGVEHISNLVTRYAVIDEHYHSSPEANPTARKQFDASLIRLYASVLEYLANAKRYYNKNTAKRLASAVICTSQSSVDMFLNKIQATEADVNACLKILDAGHMRKLQQSLDESERRDYNLDLRISQLQQHADSSNTELGEVKSEISLLADIWRELNRPICRQATQLAALHDSLERAERQELLRWLSKITYKAHHNGMGVGFLPKSGRWLIEKEEFKEWRKSSVSSVLWLRGIPGSGKTRLVYSVIERFRKENEAQESPAPLALFYCLRAEGEPERADPVEILRCILKQLCSSKAELPIREPVASLYKAKRLEADDDGCDLDSLTLTECRELIIGILNDNPATIVIDALDECDSKKRYELLEALDDIIQRSASLVKVFVSSRDDKDILCRLERSQNIFISSNDNRDDIQRFVDVEVKRAVASKRLLCGDVSELLQKKIKKTLISRAQGMFRWVSLQIENLCDPDRMIHEDDILQELGRLPKTLFDSYQVIHKRIESSGPTSKSIADRAICWLLCAKIRLRAKEFLLAVSTGTDGDYTVVSSRDLLTMCCNLVILDLEVDTFRFAHLSVQEYFQSIDEFNDIRTNGVAMVRCIQVFITAAECKVPGSSRLQKYAKSQWYGHARIAGSHHQRHLIPFFFQVCSASTPFEIWAEKERRSICYSPFLCTTATSSALLMACQFQWLELLEHISTIPHVRWDAFNIKENLNGLLIAIAHGDFSLGRWLIKQGADINAVNEKGQHLLAVWANYLHYFDLASSTAQFRFLLSNGVDLNAVDKDGQTLLASLGKEYNAEGERFRNSYSLDFARLLVKANADTNVKDHNGNTAVQILLRRSSPSFGISRNRGLVEIVDLLLGEMTDFSSLMDDRRLLIRFAAENVCSIKIMSAVNWMLDINPNLVLDGVGRTALHFAAQCGNITLLKLLLENDKTDINISDNEGSTPLCAAVNFERAEVVSRLLATSGIDVNLVGSRVHYYWIGRTPLQYAVRRSNLEMVRELLKAGADVNLDVNGKGTALHEAVGCEDINIVYALLENGCNVDINARDSNGLTALDLARRFGNTTFERAVSKTQAKTTTFKPAHLGSSSSLCLG